LEAGEKKGVPKNEGMSTEVQENKGRKKSLGVVLQKLLKTI